MPYITDNYQHKNHRSWTGFYTSTPFGKKTMKSHAQFLRGIKQLFTITKLRGLIIDSSIDNILSNCKKHHW